MQSADFLSAVFFYLKVGENLNQNWIVENLNNAFSTWNGKLGELWGLVTTGPQTFKGGAVSVSYTHLDVYKRQALHGEAARWQVYLDRGDCPGRLGHCGACGV